MDSPNATHTMERIAVLLPLPLAGAYDYAVSAGIAVSPGDLVSVPLGGRQMAGVVWGAAQGGVDAAKLKSITSKLDLPPLPDDLRAFIDWVAQYTVNPPGAVLRLAMRVPSAAPLKRPKKNAAFIPPDANHPGPQLSLQQADAAQALRDAVQAKKYSCILLQGVTGSGKTEVYFEAVAEVLRQGRQALILLPEIALTVQFLQRFAARFGAAPLEWHSQLSPARRRDIWRAVAEGAAPVVVGARSALFLPFADLGLIIADEEHDAAYKQEDGVSYHARDMAVVRAHLANIPIVLSSATPSLESVINAQSGRYRHLVLPHRHGGASLPSIELIDMRSAALEPGKFISPRLRDLMAQTLARQEQIMLFINRRGFAPLTLCRACGHRMECPHCAAWLVEHRRHDRLLCHHCGYETKKPKACPACATEDRMTAIGPGIERLAEEVAGIFPDITPVILSGDNTQGADAQHLRDTIAKFASGDIPLLIGTQIIAKGHHFPRLTLAGIIDADLGLAGGDLRAAERSFQMLHQVSGRAGRAQHPGHAVLQTYMPEHPVMQALLSGDQQAFILAETEARRARNLPPFGRLVALILSDTDPDRARAAAASLARSAPHGGEIRVLGPAPAPMALLRGRYRHRLLLMCSRSRDAQALLRQWLSQTRLPPQTRLSIDVDPYSFL